ncbi:thiamine pyrophosphate-requiring protein [Salinibacterium sp. SYSU T00001]|uniref:thiamine pyrophosphate-requiring protein n=1 Tax=Homoserinimonas sedimenticola TaxID=2986805 RepID=UPI0022367352|nr:thiamine pyrophosphate-requiring protein [Salinibacterium sedimenticola]MCW4384241.1 thiamine pyrophosphate-requiring protein [Salinibacterium sedimenticola]
MAEKGNTETVSDVIVERLLDWDVERVFGYSGDGINGFLAALQRADEGPEFVQARHEENAAFMAVGHAKYTGAVGVVTSTQGPGAVHLLNGLYDAKLDHVPVVAIVGQQTTSVLGSGYMQEINLSTLFADVASFVQLVASPEQVPMVIDRAFRSALSNRGPAVVILPHDVQIADAPEHEHTHGVMLTSAVFDRGRILPPAEQLEAAARVLAEGSRVALLVGQGAKDAGEEVVAIAEKLGAGITTSLLGKPYVDESLPFSTGVMGHLGTTASGHLLGNCDTLLIVGSSDPWTEFYPAPGQARAVQIDVDAGRIGDRYPVEVGLAGDAAATLRALVKVLPEASDRSWRQEVEEQVRTWHEISETRALVDAQPVNPELVVRRLSERMPADAQVALDVGSIVYWYARQLRLPPGVPAHVSSTLASMGCGMPYGIAGKLAHPERPMIVLAGDGGTQMTGVAELITLSKMWPRWNDPRFVLCVINNRDLAEVSWEQRENEGEPRFAASQALPDFRYSAYAELLGLQGILVDDPAQLADAWDAALSSERPVVLEVITDPSTPLLPPFPAGEEKLDTMHDAIDREGESGERANALLTEYAGHEHHEE